MNLTRKKPAESFESWLSKMPYWEQYIWKINLEKESLIDADIEQCYQYLLQNLSLIPPARPGTRPKISFQGAFGESQKVVPMPLQLKILEVKDFENVNAISEKCSIKLGDNLTLIYGGNGSGKSGVSRLLGNACFARGEREVLPNVKEPSNADPAKATFVVSDALGNSSRTLTYSVGDFCEDLKSFSVFDCKSVSIHLDGSNNVKFTPAQMQIFDKVADTISKLENRLTGEKVKKVKGNPFESLFIAANEESDTARFCMGISADTKRDDLLKHATYDPVIDGRQSADLQKQINEKRKLDIPKKRLELRSESQNLTALKKSLLQVKSKFTREKETEINKLIGAIVEKRELAKQLSVQSFDDGILKTTGTGEWRELIGAAKVLYESEKRALEGREPQHCMLCRQGLTKKEVTLFARYWKFLESRAEHELAELTRRQSSLLNELRAVKATFPKFNLTDAGVRNLKDADATYLAELKTYFSSLAGGLPDWISNIEELKPVSRDAVPEVALSKIDELIKSRNAEAAKLIDPTKEIERLSKQLISLKHRKAVAAVKGRAIEYLDYLHWLKRADRVNFATVKMMTTRKRTETFLDRVAERYEEVFNEELAKLGCEFSLVMHTSGEQGNTVKEFQLDFAEGYSPSQILSEGEQNVCSLADFLTEADLDPHNCGLIFDDPVTSLDHQRKEKIAERFVLKAGNKQVVIFTHDIVFMSQLVKHAARNQIPVTTHWMRRQNGVPGCVEDNTSPKLANLASLKNDAQNAIRGYEDLGAKAQEVALGGAFDYLRSACEALIEELLFNKAIQRYDDQIRVQNLEEAIFDQPIALRIVELHGRISEVLLAHNRSDTKREDPPSINDYHSMRKDFEDLERDLQNSRKMSIKARSTRRADRTDVKTGW